MCTYTFRNWSYIVKTCKWISKLILIFNWLEMTPLTIYKFPAIFIYYIAIPELPSHIPTFYYLQTSLMATIANRKSFSSFTISWSYIQNTQFDCIYDWPDWPAHGCYVKYKFLVGFNLISPDRWKSLPKCCCNKLNWFIKITTTQE